jgi:heterodisulfide reductase subunit B
MKYSLFLGCNIPARVTQYESASRAVLDRLGVELVDIEEFNCCGYPFRNVNQDAFLLLAARNLALAEREGLDMITLCQCCFGSLKKADHFLKENPAVLQRINVQLEREHLGYRGVTEVKHLLQVLYHDIGTDALRQAMTATYNGLRVATHYGCHLLRPSKVVEFDNPLAPTLFDQLVEITGAESVYWPRRLECCGAPLCGINDELSMDLTEKKLTDALECDAEYLCVACPYCQMQFDTIQDGMHMQGRLDQRLPSLLYPQLLGCCMGLEERSLGLEMHRIPVGDLAGHLSGDNDAVQRKNERRNVA